MRKTVSSLALCSLLAGFAFAANAAEPEVLVDCEQISLDGPVQLVNVPLGMPQPDLAQIAIPRCNCTRPGTSIPPGQLGVKCASPIGGPLRTCQALVCLQNLATPWINGVCA